MTHRIKLKEQYAKAVEAGEKTFEIRYNDRGYQKGDLIIFNVVTNDGDDAGLNTLYNLPIYEITYVHSGLGMEHGYVALAIRPICLGLPTKEPITKND